MKAVYSFKHVTCHKVNLRESEVFVKIVVYPFAIPITWFLLNFTRIRANQVTVTGLLAAVFGGVAAAITNKPWPAVLGYGLAYLLDFIDGRLARTHGGTSSGAFLDFLTDRLSFSILVISLATHHFRNSAAAEVYWLLATYQLFVLFDVYAFAKTYLKGAKPEPSKFHNEVCDSPLKQSFGSVKMWLPSRLGAPVWGIAVYAMTGSAVHAYLGMFCAVAMEWSGLTYGMIRRYLCRQ